MFRTVPQSFFRPTADVVAPGLLGKWLVRRTSRGLCGGPIVETEAYLTDDPACHAFVGQTERNKAMWGPPGFSYVYLIYGSYFCVNAVCCPAGIAEAVLIRAIEPALGLEIMQSHRPDQPLANLSSGPGKLCLALAIDRSLDAVDLCNVQSPLFIADKGTATTSELSTNSRTVVTSRRIGITKAAHLPLRFYLRDSPFVSRKEKQG